MPKEL